MSRVTGRQIVAARALLGMTQETLAKLAGVAKTTMLRVEADYDGKGDFKLSTIERVMRVLCERGIRFVHNGVILDKENVDERS